MFLYLYILQMSKDLKGVTNALGGALKSMNLEEMAKVMNKFEGQFEDLDVHASVCYV